MKCIQKFDWKPPGKRTFGRLECRWEDTIKTNIWEMVCGDVNWNELSQDMAFHGNSNEPEHNHLLEINMHLTTSMYWG
jgi:hypothetical protein